MSFRKGIVLLFVASGAPFVVNGSPQQGRGPSKTRGKAEYERICGECHDLGVGTGNRRTRQQWAAVVDDMAAMGARGSKAELQRVVDYLTANFGM